MQFIISYVITLSLLTPLSALYLSEGYSWEQLSVTDESVVQHAEVIITHLVAWQ